MEAWLPARVRVYVGAALRCACTCTKCCAGRGSRPATRADHARAQALARGLAALPGVVLDAGAIETNIVFFHLDTAVLSTDRYLAKVARGEEAGVASVDLAPGMPVCEAFAKIVRALCGARIGSYGGGRLRAVTHHQVTDEHVAAVLDAAKVAVRLLA